MREEVYKGIMNHAQELGIKDMKILQYDPGHSKISMDIIPENINLYGNIHGGVIFTLCDIAAGICAYAYEVANVTMQGSINFIRGISKGTLYVEAIAKHKGRSTVVTGVTVMNEKDELIADATFTMFLVKEM